MDDASPEVLGSKPLTKIPMLLSLTLGHAETFLFSWLAVQILLLKAQKHHLIVI